MATNSLFWSTWVFVIILNVLHLLVCDFPVEFALIISNCSEHRSFHPYRLFCYLPMPVLHSFPISSEFSILLFGFFWFLLIMWFLLIIIISTSVVTLLVHNLSLSNLMSFLTSFMSTWSFLDSTFAFVFVFPRICYNMKSCNFKYYLACCLFNLCDSWKYLRFLWSIQTSNFSIAFSKYYLHFVKAFTIVSNFLL